MENEIKKSKHIPHRRYAQKYRQRMTASEHKLTDRIMFQVYVCVILVAIILVIAHVKPIQYISIDIKNAISTDMSEKQAEYIKDKIVNIVGKVKNVKNMKSSAKSTKNSEAAEQQSSQSNQSSQDNQNNQDNKSDTSKQSIIDTMWFVPLKGIITSFFGERENPTSENESCQFHQGIDIAVDENTDVYAARSGTVEFSGYSKTYGNEVKIDTDDGYETIYAHLNKACVKDGDKVKAGQLIAYSGNSGDSTGPHLHFGIYKNGKAENPMDFYNQNDFEK